MMNQFMVEGKINWWAFAAIVTPLVMTVVFWLVLEIRSTDRELLKTLIFQVADSQLKHQTDAEKIYAGMQKSIEKQNDVIQELKDNNKTLWWAISMPYDQRKDRFNFIFPKTDSKTKNE